MKFSGAEALASGASMIAGMAALCSAARHAGAESKGVHKVRRGGLREGVILS